MSFAKSLVKSFIHGLGLKVEFRDHLDEQIPQKYTRSPYLPRVHRQNVGRLFYFKKIIDQIRDVSGDVVECGVSVGYGMLFWALLTELTGQERKLWGFDSFEGFPPSSEDDRKLDNSFQTHQREFSSPPELVMKVLADGRVSKSFIENSVKLVRGFFDKSLSTYQGEIALLHLDCDLYESYKTCLEALYPKVRTGGAVMFDEYEDSNFPGAKKAIDEFFRDRPEKPIRHEELGYVKYYVIKA